MALASRSCKEIYYAWKPGATIQKHSDLAVPDQSSTP
jgi:hypothetical protein